MSLVVAIKDGNRFILGADKQASIWNNKEHSATKVWYTEYEGCCIGSVGWARASQIVQYIKGLLDGAGFDKSELNDEYIHLQLPRTIYETLKAHGAIVENLEQPISFPNDFFIAYKDRCWKIGSDLSVTEIDEYDAIGSGSDIALGVVETALSYHEKNPYMIISKAIDIAAEKTLYVDHEIDFVETGQLKRDTVNKLDALGIEVPDEIRKSKDPAQALLSYMLNQEAAESGSPTNTDKKSNSKDKPKKDAEKNNKKDNTSKKGKSTKKQRLVENKE